jgi:hypothetical protein
MVSTFGMCGEYLYRVQISILPNSYNVNNIILSGSLDSITKLSQKIKQYEKYYRVCTKRNTTRIAVYYQW